MARSNKNDVVFVTNRNKYNRRVKYRFKPRFFVFLVLAVLILALGIWGISKLIGGKPEGNQPEGNKPSESGGGGSVQPSQITGKDAEPPVIDLTEGFTMVMGSNPENYIKTCVTTKSGAEATLKLEGDLNAEVPGEYTVKVVATAENGKKAEKDVKITIFDPAAVASGFTFITETGAKGEILDGITYIEGTMIVNHTFGLPTAYAPELDADAAEAFYAMTQAADQQGRSIFYVSGYRNYADQQSIFNSDVARYGLEEAERLTSRPGYSEHQAGLAIDVNSIYESFADTEDGKWLANNCYKYGFIIRFPRDGEAYTDIEFEPWHVRYVGEELATKLYRGDGEWMSLEEYFGIPSKYKGA